MERESIEFPGHGGTTLRGFFYRPDGDGPAPGIVMAHGFSATIAMCLDEFASFFRDAGFAVLLYDHRNLGFSDGEPRGEINPWAQTRDYRLALTWLGAREEVDAERLAVWGSSFSGGEVLVLGAVDERIKAVVANVPMAGMPGVDYSDNQAAFETMRAQLLDESGEGLADKAVGPPLELAVVEDDASERSVFLAQPESKDWFLRTGGRDGSGWRNEVTLVNAFSATPNFDPAVCAEFISPTPLLMVVASNDTLCPTKPSLETFARAREPKRLEMVEGHHFSDYEGASFEQVATVMRDFLKEHLEAR